MLKVWYDNLDWNNFGQLWNGSPINGVDIPMSRGTPITALFSGTITSQYVDDSGGVIIIRADNASQLKGIPYYYYAHLDTFIPSFSSGSHVNVGDVIGTSGGQNTGGNFNASPRWSTGEHIMIGESKFNGVPVGNQVTSDLNPSWILAYARQNRIMTNTQQCSCPGGFAPITISGVIWCEPLVPGRQPFICGEQSTSNPANIATNQLLQPIIDFAKQSGEKIAIFLLALIVFLIGVMLLLKNPVDKILK